MIRALAGLPTEERPSVSATLPVRVHSDRGRLEYVLVGLVGDDQRTAAYPMGKGSGSVTTFSLADGFIRVDEQTEIVEPGSEVSVTLLDREMKPADLVVIGSHCVGLDAILGHLRREGLTVKTMHVGSLAGLNAARRGECDLAGMHLLDPETGEYNRPYVTDGLELVRGYRRLQCLVYRPGDDRFASKPPVEAVRTALADPDCMMINRNTGSGTRALIDRLLDDAGYDPEQPPAGYGIQAKSHNAVAAAVRQGRADWGSGDRHGRQRLWSRIHTTPGRTLRLCHPEGATWQTGRTTVSGGFPKRGDASGTGCPGICIRIRRLKRIRNTPNSLIQTFPEPFLI